MKTKTLKCLEEIDTTVDIFENVNTDVELLEPSENEILILDEVEPVEFLTDTRVIEKNSFGSNDKIISIIFDNNSTPIKRASSNIDSRIDSTLTEIIGQRMQTKALPLALRKRLLYQQAIGA